MIPLENLSLTDIDRRIKILEDFLEWPKYYPNEQPVVWNHAIDASLTSLFFRGIMREFQDLKLIHIVKFEYIPAPNLTGGPSNVGSEQVICHYTVISSEKIKKHLTLMKAHRLQISTDHEYSLMPGDIILDHDIVLRLHGKNCKKDLLLLKQKSDGKYGFMEPLKPMERWLIQYLYDQRSYVHKRRWHYRILAKLYPQRKNIKNGSPKAILKSFKSINNICRRTGIKQIFIPLGKGDYMLSPEMDCTNSGFTKTVTKQYKNATVLINQQL